MLTGQYALGFDSVCGEGSGCTKAALSIAASFIHVPTPVWGLAAYISLAALSLLRHGSAMPVKYVQSVGFVLTAVGSIVSIGLVAYSGLVLQAYCSWCLASGAIMCALLSLYSAMGTREHLKPKGEPLLLGLLGTAVSIAAVVHFQVLSARASAIPHDARALSEASLATLAPLDAPRVGVRAAPVKVVVFADLTCPVTRLAIPKLCEVVEARSDCELIYRHFPLKSHATATNLAQVSELARDRGQFWDFVGNVCKDPADEVGSAVHHMSRLGVLPASTKAAWDSPPHEFPRVARDRACAVALGLRYAPAVVIWDPAGTKEIVGYRDAMAWLDENRQHTP